MLGLDGLAKQGPVTLEEARAQVLRIKARSSDTYESKKRGIQYNLSIYHPDWTQEQIENEFKKVMKDAELSDKKKNK